MGWDASKILWSCQPLSAWLVTAAGSLTKLNERVTWQPRNNINDVDIITLYCGYKAEDKSPAACQHAFVTGSFQWPAEPLSSAVHYVGLNDPEGWQKDPKKIP